MDDFGYDNWSRRAMIRDRGLSPTNVQMTSLQAENAALRAELEHDCRELRQAKGRIDTLEIAYGLTPAEMKDLHELIQKVHAGQKCIPHQVAEKPCERLSQSHLTEREREILHLIAQGKTNQKIAGALHITNSTVKYHANNILDKLNVSDHTQAALLALKRGLTTL